MNKILIDPKYHSIADLPLFVIENIFKNLRGNDLINLLLVCKNFNIAISKSKILMKKIKLKISNRNFFKKNFDFVLNTNRCYQNFTIKNIIVSDKNSTFFLKIFSNFNCKCLKLSNCRFDLKKTQIFFFKQIAKSIRELYINRTFLKKNNKKKHFLYLKNIKILNCYSNFFDFFFVVCFSLKSLSITNNNNYLIFFNKNLKCLHLNNKSFYFSALKFLKLRTLKIKEFVFEQWLTISLEAFLYSQAGSITNLKLFINKTSNWMFFAFIFNHFKNLKILKILFVYNKHSTSEDLENLNAILEPNLSINKLKIFSSCTNMLSYKFSLIIAKNCPNLKVHNIN